MDWGFVHSVKEFCLGKLVTSLGRGAQADEASKAILIAFKFLEALGLGRVGGQLSGMTALSPPEDKRQRVAKALADFLKTDLDAITVPMDLRPKGVHWLHNVS